MKINWQAHRGGAYEMPQNTIASVKYGWDLGAVVEVDIRTTFDGKIICLHNETLEETTNADKELGGINVSKLIYDQIKHLDAGSYFDRKFHHEHVPLLEELFIIMKNDKEKKLYLDLKEVDLKKLGEMIEAYQLNDQCIFCHCDIDNCIEMKKAVDIRCMLWIGGTRDQILSKFKKISDDNFFGADQIQLHLNGNNLDEEWIYVLKQEDIKMALQKTSQMNVDLEVFPFMMNRANIYQMLDMGISWFATDYPRLFKEMIEQYSKRKGE
ncbi:MAG: glycerophosphodiester phosphodiesterase [Clostridia bacterium]|nr:glycerophosphodiester phosphodiesterase [Clostridia bacterium]